jgi:hypothetical protein
VDRFDTREHLDLKTRGVASLAALRLARAKTTAPPKKQQRVEFSILTHTRALPSPPLNNPPQNEPSFADLTLSATLLSAAGATTDGGVAALPPAAVADDAADAKAAADERAATTTPPPLDNTSRLLQRLGSRGLPDAAAVVAYLGTATSSGGGAAPAAATACSPSPPPPPAAENPAPAPAPSSSGRMPPALRGLAAAVACQPAAADVVAAALDLHTLARGAVVNRPNVARMDALGAACVSALDRAGQEQQRLLGRASPCPPPLPADVCLALAAVLRDCCALAEGFGREGWLLRLACGGAGLRDEAEMLHGAALELLQGAGLGWAVPTAQQQRRAALALAALAGEGAAAALLAAQEAEGMGGGGGGGGLLRHNQHQHHQSPGKQQHQPRHQQQLNAGEGASNSNVAAGGGNSSPSLLRNPSSWGYVDASRPLRRALRQLGRGRGLAAGVAAAAADPDAADELARLLGVSPAALQAELRAVPSSSSAALATDGGQPTMMAGAATTEETAAGQESPPPSRRASPLRQQQQHQEQHEQQHQQHQHAPLDLDALHAQLLSRRDAAAFLRTGAGGGEGGTGGGGGCGSPAAAPVAPAASTPVPPALDADAATAAADGEENDHHHQQQQPTAAAAATTTTQPPMLRHPAAYARYCSVEPLMPGAPCGVSATGVRAALLDLGLLPDGALEAGAAVRRHMALALGTGGGGSGGGASSATVMPPEIFDRLFESLLASNPRARIADAAGPAAVAELRRVHTAFAAFGKRPPVAGAASASPSSSRGGGGGVGNVSSAASARPAWTGAMGRSWGGGSSYGGVAGSGGGGGGAASAGGAGPLLDSALFAKLLRECGMLRAPAGGGRQSSAAPSRGALTSALVRLGAADVDIVYTKWCACSGGGGVSGGGGGLAAPSSPSAALGGAAAALSPPPRAAASRAQQSPHPFSPSSASSPSGAPRRARGLDFDAFCGALVSLSERSGAPLVAVVGAVGASGGPAATGPSSVYMTTMPGSSVAGSVAAAHHHRHQQQQTTTTRGSASVIGGGGGGRRQQQQQQQRAGSVVTAAATTTAPTTTPPSKGAAAGKRGAGAAAAVAVATTATSPGWRR